MEVDEVWACVLVYMLWDTWDTCLPHHNPDMHINPKSLVITAFLTIENHQLFGSLPNWFVTKRSVYTIIICKEDTLCLHAVI